LGHIAHKSKPEAEFPAFRPLPAGRRTAVRDALKLLAMLRLSSRRPIPVCVAE
jgi:hypothetical protein